MGRKYRIIRISEADFGCEELQPGEEVKALVTLQDEAGETKQLEMSDQYLTNHHIEEGSLVTFSEEGEMKLILQE